MAERTVNARQLEVLRWVVDGCPDGVMTDVTYKTSAVALRGRRLVTVTKRGGRWKAESTDAGRYFIEHGAYPADHWVLARNTSAPTPVWAGRRTARLERQRKVTGARPVDQLIADVVAADGRLDVESDGGYYETLVSSAIRSGKVPDGKLLQIKRGPVWGQLAVELVDKPEFG